MNRVSLCSQSKKTGVSSTTSFLDAHYKYGGHLSTTEIAPVSFSFSATSLALVDRFHRIFSQSSTCALFLLLWHFRKICTTAFAERRVRRLVCWQILTICSWTHWVRKSIKQWCFQMVDIWKGQLLIYWEGQLHEDEKQVHQGDTVARRTFQTSTWQTKSCGNLVAIKCCPHKYWSWGLAPYY